MGAGANADDASLRAELIAIVDGDLKIRGVSRPDALQQLARLIRHDGVAVYERRLSDRDPTMQVLAMLSLVRYDPNGRARAACEGWARRKLRRRRGRTTSHPIEIFLILSYFDSIEQVEFAARLFERFKAELDPVEQRALDMVWAPSARRAWAESLPLDRPYLVVFGSDRIPTDLSFDLVIADVNRHEPSWRMPPPGEHVDPLQRQAMDAFTVLSARVQGRDGV